MVNIGTRLVVVDNLGARYAVCINILGSFSYFARVGNRIIIVIKNAIPRKKVKRHDVRLSLCLRTRHRNFRINGSSFFSLSNSCVVLDKKRGFLFTRIYGAVPFEWRRTKYFRIWSISKGIY